MQKDTIRIELESKMGPITHEELNFAIEQFEANCSQAKATRKLYDSTAYDMLATNIDYFRRNRLSVRG